MKPGNEAKLVESIGEHIKIRKRIRIRKEY